MRTQDGSVTADCTKATLSIQLEKQLRECPCSCFHSLVQHGHSIKVTVSRSASNRRKYSQPPRWELLWSGKMEMLLLYQTGSWPTENFNSSWWCRKPILCLLYLMPAFVALQKVGQIWVRQSNEMAPVHPEWVRTKSRPFKNVNISTLNMNGPKCGKDTVFFFRFFGLDASEHELACVSVSVWVAGCKVPVTSLMPRNEEAPSMRFYDINLAIIAPFRNLQPVAI